MYSTNLSVVITITITSTTVVAATCQDSLNTVNSIYLLYVSPL
jgi:hypothetical protein